MPRAFIPLTQKQATFHAGIASTSLPWLELLKQKEMQKGPDVLRRLKAGAPGGQVTEYQATPRSSQVQGNIWNEYFIHHILPSVQTQT